MPQRNSCKKMTRTAYSGQRIADRKDKKIFLLYAIRYTLNAVACFILIFAISGCGSSFHFSRREFPKGPASDISGSHQLRIGEKLTYEIRWMGIPVAIASFNVKETVNINARECYHIEVWVRSNAFLSKIYRVDDEFHTFIDKEKLYSLRFIKRQAEGRYRSYEVVDYDQEVHQAIYKSFLNNSRKDFAIRENSQDDLSAIYCFRIRDVTVGGSVVMDVNADEKNWVLHIDVLQQGVMRLHRIGNLKAIEVEPRAVSADGKPLEKGRAWIWFSADENRIPLAAKARAAIVGTVTAVLTKVE